MNARTIRFLIGATVALIMAMLFFVSSMPGPAHAASTFTVNSNLDVADANPGDGKCETAPGNGICTLRAAIMEANATSGGATIHFEPSNAITYTLGLGQLSLTNTVTINGAGAAHTIIDGDGSVTNDRVFEIGSGVAVTLTGMTIQNGKVDCICHGGGIDNSGVLSLLNVTLRDNLAFYGGGIQNDGAMILTNSTLRNNLARQNGGGIQNDGILLLMNSTLDGNVADSIGGGLFNEDGRATLEKVTLSGNQAQFGGGIYNDTRVDLVNGTISGNNANEDGGGIDSPGASGDPSEVNVFNTTITHNQADADFNGSGQGGGVRNAGLSAFNLQNSILAGNAETTSYAGIWFPVTGECAGSIISSGDNLMENYDTGHCTITGTTPPLVDPKLGPLTNNGGSTQTHALLPGSPAIDAGPSMGCFGPLALLTIDQRGFPRPVFGGTALRCDIGAVEYYPNASLLPLIQR